MSPSISYTNEKELMGRSSSSRIFESGGGIPPPERRSSRAGGCDPPRRSSRSDLRREKWCSRRDGAGAAAEQAGVTFAAAARYRGEVTPHRRSSNMIFFAGRGVYPRPQ